MLLFNRGSWRDHKVWCFFVVVATLLALGWLIVARQEDRDWPSGSSLPGFTFGVLGGLIILFEGFLWIRKRFLRVWRIGRTQVWLRAHIWLGLLCGPLLLFHSGFRWGGTLSTVLSLLLIVVLFSGIIGLALQNWLPRKMLHEVPAETIYSQLGYLSGELADDARRLVLAVCGPAPGESPQVAAAAREDAGHLVIGAVRVAGRVTGKVLGTRAAIDLIADTEALREFLNGHLEPYLRNGSSSDSELAVEANAQRMFDDLRTKLPHEAHDAVYALQGFCDQRRQWDAQAWMHLILHSWLIAHFAFSVALIALMFLHIFVTLKFW